MCNNGPLNQLDRTCMRETAPIDSRATTSGLFEFVEGVELLNHNDAILSDHYSCLICMSIENYFNDHFSVRDLVDDTSLNLLRQSYRITFCEELEE